MALEDFFTLSEMKDGLANLVRVEELLSIMHSQKDSVRNIVGDAARQWATVANIIAATERKDCLDHFVRLNGLSYLNHWLQEAQKQSGGSSSSDSSAEELIGATLRALDRLPVDRDASSASGIGATIKQLHGYGRGEDVQEKVKTLSLKWSFSEGSDMNSQPADGEVASCDDALKSSPQTAGKEQQQQQEEEEEGVQSSDPALEVPPSNDLPGDGAAADESVAGQKSSDQASPCDVSNAVDKDGVSGAQSSSPAPAPAPAPCQEGLPTGEPAVGAAGPASPAPSPSAEAGDEDADEESDASHGNDASDRAEDMDIEVNTEEPSPCDSGPGDLPYASPETSLHKMDFMEATGNEPPGGKAEKGVEPKASGASSKRSAAAGAAVGELKQGRSEIGLEYGEIDALEVARQVAIEVEREVVDYREPFCSSSPEVASGGENVDSSSMDLAENASRRPGSEERGENGSSSSEDVSEGSSSKNSSRSSDDAAGVKESAAEPASPKSASSVHESVGNSEKKKCDFDLNEDFCSEEADCPVAPTAAPATNLSTPIPVAAPKGAAALPATPLRFEGELGWRGSAATSAFRPASPRRTPDGEKSVSGPKQKAAFFTIDLNIADGEDNEDSAVNNPLDGRSSSIPSDKSSMEMGSRADRLKLDLNRSEDEDVMPNQASYWRPPHQQHHQNGNRCASPASSSSSRQPSFRDFDLNDDPSAFDACGSSSLGRSTSKESAAYRGYNKFEDPAAVTIMGSRMAVERRDLATQQTQRAAFSGSGGGLCLDAGAAAATRGASAPYPAMPPHGFSYHGLQMGPAMSILPPFYGPGSIPYMVDSSGTAVVPQILSSPGLGVAGGSSGGGGGGGGRPPFFMSVVGPPSGLNMVGGGGVPRPGLDLNSGAAHGGEGGGGREMIGSLKHMQGSSGFMEERVASASQLPAGSGMVLKRKEPDRGWEPPYTFGCKQATSWQ